jgi:hypothetical protein
MYNGSLVYSNTAVASTDGVVSTGRHTSSIKFLNTHATTNAVVRVNGGPLSVLIPAISSGGGYVELFGDYTSFEVVTASVTLAVIAFG